MTPAKQNARLNDNTISITLAIATALLVSLFSVIAGIEHTPSAIEAPESPSETVTIATPETPETPDQLDLDQLDDTTSPTSLADTIIPQSDVTSPETDPSIPAAGETTPEPGANRFAENMRLDLPYLVFEARFPIGSSQDPAYQRTMEDISRYRDSLRTSAENAKADRESSNIGFHTWDVDIQFQETGRVGNLVSAIGREYSYTGGAHPNLNWQGLIANNETGEVLKLENLFKPRAMNSPALAIAACEALIKAKVERIGEATIDGDPIDCGSNITRMRINQAEKALTGSTEKNKFGGVVMMFAPYVLGPYVEGPYTLIVSQGVFREDLRPEYQPLFAGNAVRPRTD